MKRKIYFQFFNVLFGILIVFFVTSCEDDTPEIDLAVVKTIEVTDIMYNQVTVAGSIISNGGDSIIERGICWNKQPNPTISDFSEHSIENDANDFSVELKKLNNNIQYYVRSYATNSQGTSYGQEISFTLWLNLPDELVTDIDNNNYSTIRIGDQVWMKENLKVTHYRNGDEISYISLQNDSEWINTKSGAYCAYGDEVINADKYGYLYNGCAIFDNRAVCPEGWHIPTKEEWETLINYLGGIYTSGNMLKGSNSSGFTALPGGARLALLDESTSSIYWHGKKTGFFASQDEYTYNSNRIWYIQIFNEGGYVQLHYNISKNCGQSIRCIKD